MDNLNYQQICEEVVTLARHVGLWLCSERQSLTSVKMKAKGVHDYVTQFDKESEKTIVAKLKELVPEAGFIAEEDTERGLEDQYTGLWTLWTAPRTSSTACRPPPSASP